MNVIALLKRVPDASARIEIEKGSVGIKADIPWILNPYDEYGVEEAVRIKERFGGTVTAMNAGTEGGEEVLKKAIAMGADSAVFIRDRIFHTLDGLNIARVLSAVIKKMPFDIILCGKQAADDNAGAVGAALSGLLDIPFVSSVKKLTISLDQSRAEAVREGEGRTETVECRLPALFAAARGLNEPRYPSLAGIMRAKKEGIKFLDMNSTGLDPEYIAQNVKTEKFYYPLKSRRQVVLGGDIKEQVKEAVRFLRGEVKVV